MNKRIQLLQSLSAIIDIYHMEMSSMVKSCIADAIQILISELSKEAEDIKNF